MSDEIEVVVTIPESVVETEKIEVVAPIIDPVTSPEMLEELIALREFKRASDEARIVEVENVAAEAARVAELALEIAVIPEREVEIIVEPVDDIDATPPVDIEPDSGPSNSHSWFKNWFGK